MTELDLTGAVDLHVHTAPDLYERSLDAEEAVRQAAEAGMRAILLKSHHLPTMDRAALARGPDGPEVYGGIALNLPVGGLNPVAVETAVELGAKQVWMPTLHAAHCLENATQRMFRAEVERGRQGIRILDAGLRLLPEVAMILEIVRDAGVILGTGHLSPEEGLALLAEARDMGLERLLVTHPLMSFVRYDLEAMRKAVAHGAMLELDRLSCSPQWPEAVPVGEAARVVREIGAENIVLGSDGGQTFSPTPVDMLRAFAVDLAVEGIPERQVRRMLCDNPADLLDL